MAGTPWSMPRPRELASVLTQTPEEGRPGVLPGVLGAGS